MAEALSVSGIVSLRLTPDERQLIEQAAAKKGWKSAKFLRVSAIERAAHVLNLSRPTSFDFTGVAKRLAEALVGQRTVEIGEFANLGDPIGRFGEGQVENPPLPFQSGTVHMNLKLTLDECFLRDFSPAALTPEEVDRLQAALRLGGLDFAEQLVSECRRLSGAANDQNLPPPIDPQGTF